MNCKRSFLSIIIMGALLGCSKTKGLLLEDSPLEKEFASQLVSTVPSNWFKQPARFSLEGDNEQIPPHFFFDINPDINMLKNTLSFVIETPQMSPHEYKIDVFSGQHYYNFEYCESDDVWDRYEYKIKLPPYSIGIIPRVFDQLGTPQKIMVFGDAKYYQEHYRENFFDAKIIGGFIEQYCDFGACLEQKMWKSRLVLVGVQTGNRDFEKVENIGDLKEVVDWPAVQAFVENGQGQNKLSQKFYPAYKMGTPIDAKSAMNYMRQSSIFFTVKKLTTMRNSCYALYDKAWQELGSDSEVESKLRTMESMIERAKLEAKARVSAKDYFYKRFITFFKDYERELKTCMKYIYYGNHHMDSTRFWFFTYFKAFALAHEEGYTYRCNRGSWIRNPIIIGGKRAIPLQKEMRGCDARRIDQSFDATMLLLSNLTSNHSKSYRFIDYDRGAKGTHKKLYSWVSIPSQRYRCANGSEHFLNAPTFIKDKRWKDREIKFQSSGKLNY